jgi:uncharacterized protein
MAMEGCAMTATVNLKVGQSEVKTLELEPYLTRTSLDGGEAEARDREVWSGGEGAVITGVWETDPGRFRVDFGDFGEFIHVVQGEMTCTGDDGVMTELEAGDTMTFPTGWSGEWNVRAPLRKVYCTFKLG